VTGDTDHAARGLHEDTRRERQVELRDVHCDVVHRVARFVRYYGQSLDATLTMPYGWFCALFEEIPRLAALEKRDLVDVVHTSDARWLCERLTAIAQHTNVVLPSGHDEQHTINEWQRLERFIG
jgi:hypothetical protein